MSRGRTQGERGAILLFVLVILAALLTGAGIALYVQLGSTRGAGLARFARSSLYCSEAGLQAARPIIINNYPTWNAVLDPMVANPAWYGTGGIMGDAGDGDADNDDWLVTIEDNVDEFPVNNPDRDNDLTVVVRSQCLMFLPDQPREVVEIVNYKYVPTNYKRGEGDSAAGLNEQTP